VDVVKLRGHVFAKRCVFCCSVLSGLVFLCSSASFAALGDDVASVQSDQARMNAQARVLPNQSFSIHELQMPTGTIVREFVSTGGTVFGVAWQGAFAPDLQQLLGAHFDEYMRAAQIPENRRGRGLHIETDDMVFESGGHMRFIIGRAYLRSRLPQGVTSDAVR
jgi:hypothetical protein